MSITLADTCGHGIYFGKVNKWFSHLTDGCAIASVEPVAR
jgi:hypothetical protein